MAIADISTSTVFVHGIQGHPYRTWATKPARSPFKLPFRAHLLGSGSRSREKTNPSKSTISQLPQNQSTQSSDAVFWPRDLLPLDCDNIRIMTWGYESNVSRFFSGSVDKGNIFDHAKNLMYSLHRLRHTCVSAALIILSFNAC